MADRQQVPGWNNINLNKPEEYSSEFVVDGIRYANVTNVTTGQRQLYYIQPVSNARGLLTTTNADGTITKGGNYNNFVQFNGVNKLNNAEKANKQQSISLLSTKDIATPTETAAIKNSKEFKSTAAGQNRATNPGGTENGTAPVDLKVEGTGKKKGFGNHTYPLDLDKSKQDKIKFSMLQYSPRGFQSDTNQLGGFSERSKKRSILGTVILPIPSGISESNSAGWGEDRMDPGQALLANAALASIKQGLSAGFDTLGEAAAGATGTGNKEVKTAVATGFAQAATGVGGLLSRTQGAVINPNLELLFNGPALRPFNFTFKMSARSEAEAKQIIKIIRFFKQGMAPQKSTSNLFIKAPHTFKIQYLLGSSKDKNHPFIGQIKECALQSFTVNYTPEGQYSTFYDGPMVSYEIQMTLQELEPVFNEDYGTGGSDLPENLLFKE